MKSKTKTLVSMFTVVFLITLCAGCIDSQENVGLSISDFHFCSAIRGADDYDSHATTYTSGEQVFMYFELRGFEVRSDKSAQIYQTLTVTVPNGTPLMTDEGVSIENFEMLDQSIDTTGMNFLWFNNYLWQINESWVTGTYEVIIVVEDRVANKSVTYSTEFNIA